MFKKWFVDRKNRDLIIIVVLLILNILPRLIYILNRGFFLDGDEAILGTVVQDFVYNHHFTLFLSGQNYGFVSLEVLVSSFISLFFGVNIYSLKIAIFLFWLANVVVLYYIGKKIFSSRYLTVLTVLLISFTPVWYEWATKARFGYVSALLISNVVILLAFSKRNILRIISVCLLLLFVYYLQPLYLVILFPFLAYYFLKDFKFKDSAIFVFCSLIFLVISRFLLIYSGFTYQLQNKIGLNEVARNIKYFFSNYSVAYSGRFFDDVVFINYYPATIASYIFIGILLLVIIYDIYRFFKHQITKIEILFLLAILFYSFFMLFYNGITYSYRYLLPIFVPSIFLIVLALKQLTSLKLKKFLYIFLIIFAFFSLNCGIFAYNCTYPRLNDGYTEIDRINALGEFLNTNHIKCVYALNWIISQHIDYFIPEVIVRHQEIDPRRPWDSQIVDFYQNSKQCALVGFLYQAPAFTYLYKLNDIYIVDNRYLIHLRPQRDDLLKLNFQLTN